MSDTGKNVLIVDDDPVQLVLRSMQFKKIGFQPVTATTAAKALELLRAAPAGTFHLVVTDHMLDDSTGPKLVRAMRTEYPDLPIIVFTGYPDAEIEYKGLNIHFHVKPSSPPELMALARQVAR